MSVCNVPLGGVSLTLRHRLECKVMTKEKIDLYHGQTCPMDAEEFLAPTVTSKFSSFSLNPADTEKETESAHYLVSSVSHVSINCCGITIPLYPHEIHTA